jgi:magnesium chelatase family protein
VPWADLDGEGSGETSDVVRERVAAARERQLRRGVACNARIPDRRLNALIGADAEARALLGRAVDRLKLSARAARRVLRIARTVADLAGETPVGRRSMAEALGYRAEREVE